MGGRVDAVGLAGEGNGRVVFGLGGRGADFVDVGATLEPVNGGLSDILFERTTSISIASNRVHHAPSEYALSRVTARTLTRKYVCVSI